MSLRGEPVEVEAALPDGREVSIRVGVPEDPYVPAGERSTVVVELHEGGRPLAAVETALDPEETSLGRELARAIADALEHGSAEPSAAAIETFVDRV